MTQFIYRKTEPSLWTVGFYTPDGDWLPESYHTIKEDAARRVHYLKGGNNTDDKAIADNTRDLWKHQTSQAD